MKEADTSRHNLSLRTGLVDPKSSSLLPPPGPAATGRASWRAIILQLGGEPPACSGTSKSLLNLFMHIFSKIVHWQHRGFSKDTSSMQFASAFAMKGAPMEHTPCPRCPGRSWSFLVQLPSSKSARYTSVKKSQVEVLGGRVSKTQSTHCLTVGLA